MRWKEKIEIYWGMGEIRMYWKVRLKFMWKNEMEIHRIEKG